MNMWLKQINSNLYNNDILTVEPPYHPRATGTHVSGLYSAGEGRGEVPCGTRYPRTFNHE